MATVLTIGDVEPERPTIAINRMAPDGRWQRWKYDHLDVLLRWAPVRFARRSELYPLRLPSEFGMRGLARLRARQAELAGLDQDDEAAMRRAERLLQQITAMVLEAPSDVIRSLTVQQHLQVLAVFPAAVTGQMPPTTEASPSSPSTSDDSSHASAASIQAAAGRTG